MRVLFGVLNLFCLEYWSLPPEGHTYVLDVPPLLGAQLPSHPAGLLSYRLHRGSPCIPRTLHSLWMFFRTLGRASAEAVSWWIHGWASWHHACNDVWVTRLLVAVVRGCCYNHVFSAVALHCNQRMSPHVDVHNADGRPNLLIPCTRWSGGGLWVSDNQRARTLSADSEAGRVIHITQPYTIMNPHVLHATMEWAGNRVLLVAYAVADPRKRLASDGQRLRDLGFSVQY